MGLMFSFFTFNIFLVYPFCSWILLLLVTQMTTYDASYTCAKMEMWMETSGYTYLKKIKAFWNLQEINKTIKKYIILQVYEMDESICKNEANDHKDKFCFFYDTVFVKLDLRLSFDLFEKEIIIIMNVIST